MELFGSFASISGSMTASVFSGSFIGDGSGLRDIPLNALSGFTVNEISDGPATANITEENGFVVSTNTLIDGDLIVTGSITAQNYIVSSSVTYMTTSYASGSSAFGDTQADVHQFTGSVQITGSISLNGEPIGTAGDNIFNMLHSRYQQKVKEKIFVGQDGSAVAPTSPTAAN